MIEHLQLTVRAHKVLVSVAAEMTIDQDDLSALHAALTRKTFKGRKNCGRLTITEIDDEFQRVGLGPRSLPYKGLFSQSVLPFGISSSRGTNGPYLGKGLQYQGFIIRASHTLRYPRLFRRVGSRASRPRTNEHVTNSVAAGDAGDLHGERVRSDARLRFCRIQQQRSGEHRQLE